MQKNAIAHSKQIDAFLAVRFTIINPFDRKRIADRPGRLVERNTVVAPVARSFAVVPSEAF
jgi:hypothetical protein